MRSGKVDTRWARTAPGGTRAGCCAAPVGVTGRLLLVAGDSEVLQAIRLPNEALESYPRGGIDVPVRVATPSGREVLAGLVRP